MGLNWTQFHAGVLVPALKALEPQIPYSEVADRLVAETIWHESDRLRALGQYPIGGVSETTPFGPGLGVCSMEQPTWNWLVNTPGCPNEMLFDDYESLAWDLRLNVIACRYRYFIDQRALPKLEDGVEARATYWWKVYNGGQVDRRPDYIRNAKEILWTT